MDGTLVRYTVLQVFVLKIIFKVMATSITKKTIVEAPKLGLVSINGFTDLFGKLMSVSVNPSILKHGLTQYESPVHHLFSFEE
jgi:hypothetical protein